jgi:NTE family protein
MENADSVVTRAALPMPTMPGWRTLNALRHPTQIPGAIATMLPHGLFDHSPRVAMLERLANTWPSKRLWISAVRVGDGRLEWFGRDPQVEGAQLASAVAASCAIPVLARPVPIGDHRYVDGGISSATHADVLLDTDLDLVVVLSPMGQQTGRNPVRALAHRRVRREVARLERAGIAVQLISPDRDTLRAMGLNMMDRARIGPVMRQAFLGAAAQIDARVADVLSGARAASAR